MSIDEAFREKYQLKFKTIRAMNQNQFLTSDIDEYGFVKSTNSKEFHEYKSIYYHILTRRSMRWTKIFGDRIKEGQILRRFIRKGIPLSRRSEIWMKTSRCSQQLSKNPNFYSDLLKSQYQEDIVETVKIDIPRTFPDNIYFDVHKMSMFNVLIAFSLQNVDVGYCQGLNYIAGMLLIVTKDEETSFWLMKHLVEEVASEYHSKTMYGLQRDMHVISELVKLQQPLIYEKVNELGLPWAVILTKWLICMFSEVLPVETLLRIWDVMFAEGYKIIFRAALGIIYVLKDEIMKTNDINDLAELFRNLDTNPLLIDCHSFIDFMFKIKITRRQIENLRATFPK